MKGERINIMRTDKALAQGTDLVGTVCPFCLTMVSDGIAAWEAGKRLKALNIASSDLDARKTLVEIGFE